MADSLFSNTSQKTDSKVRVFSTLGGVKPLHSSPFFLLFQQISDYLNDNAPPQFLAFEHLVPVGDDV